MDKLLCSLWIMMMNIDKVTCVALKLSINAVLILRTICLVPSMVSSLYLFSTLSLSYHGIWVNSSALSSDTIPYGNAFNCAMHLVIASTAQFDHLPFFIRI